MFAGTALAVVDYLNLADLVSHVANPTTLVVTILSDNQWSAVLTPNFSTVRPAWNLNRGGTI